MINNIQGSDIEFVLQCHSQFVQHFINVRNCQYMTKAQKQSELIFELEFYVAALGRFN